MRNLKALVNVVMVAAFITAIAETKNNTVKQRFLVKLV